MRIRLGELREAITRGVRLRCPRCGSGVLFRGPFTMLQNCGECHLRFEREPGYFIGAIYINYGVTVAIAVAGFFLLERFAGPSLGVQLGVWVAFCVLFPLWLYRYTKSLWLAIDHFLDPEEGDEGQTR